jgi:O-antigen/teichoic acid export membrane protein
LPGAAVSDGGTSGNRLDYLLLTGIAWTAVLRWPAHAISWIATGVAARILAPADYGVVSMAMIAIGLVRWSRTGSDAVLVRPDHRRRAAGATGDR